MKAKRTTFGQVLRERRLEKGHTLRKFSALVGVSPTYLSQVEQDNVDPPTAERVKAMAELLEANVDEWCALAGRLAEDLTGIIHGRPVMLPQLLRAAGGLTPEQLQKLVDEAKRLQKGG